MNGVSEKGKKTGFWYGRLRIQWGDPRKMKNTAGGSWRGIMGTCSRERFGFNGLKWITSISRDCIRSLSRGGNKQKKLRKDQPEMIQTHIKVPGCWRGRERNSCSPLLAHEWLALKAMCQRSCEAATAQDKITGHLLEQRFFQTEV